MAEPIDDEIARLQTPARDEEIERLQTPTPAPGSWENPLQEAGLKSIERFYIQNYSPSPESTVEWLERSPGVGGKPKELPWGPLGTLAQPVGQYEAKIYDRDKGLIAVRAKGDTGPFKVIDPQTGAISKDIGGDILDVLYGVAMAPVKVGSSALGYAATQAGAEANRIASGKEFGFKDPRDITGKALDVAIAGATAGALDKTLGLLGKYEVGKKALTGIRKAPGMESLRSLAGGAVRGLGGIPRFPLAVFKRITGEAQAERLQEVLRRLNLSEEGLQRPLKAKMALETFGTKGEALPGQTRLKKALAEVAKIKDRLAREREAKEAALMAEAKAYGKKLASGEIGGVPPMRKIEIPPEFPERPSGTFIGAEDVLRKPGAPIRGKYGALDPETINPATGITARFLRVWPEMRGAIQDLFPEGVFNILGSFGMKERDLGFGRLRTYLQRELGDEGLKSYNSMMGAFGGRAAGIVEKDPVYQSLLRTSEAELALGRLKKLSGTPDDIKMLGRLIQEVAEKKIRPPELARAMEEARAARVPVLEGRAKLAALEEMQAPAKRDIIEQKAKFERKRQRIRGRMESLPREAMQSAPSLIGPLLRDLDRIGTPIQALGKKISGVPPKIEKILDRARRLYAESKKGGGFVARETAEEFLSRMLLNQEFREWAQENIGSTGYMGTYFEEE